MPLFFAHNILGSRKKKELFLGMVGAVNWKEAFKGWYKDEHWGWKDDFIVA